MSGVSFRETSIAFGANRPRSLCWRGDELVDWVSGGNRFAADGGFVDAHRGWGYPRLDAATTDASGRWAAVYERTGTAAILLCDGEIVRSFHREPYHADAFEFPLCLFADASGRVLLAHCPESYAEIEIDDAATGERLTRSQARKAPDFFHSRLAFSPGGRRLLSAGWVWHPWDAVVWYDVADALRDPTTLDVLCGPELSRNVCLAEESSAAWLDDDTLLLGGSDEREDPEEATAHPGPRLWPNGLAIYDVAAKQYRAGFSLGYPPGKMLPVGPAHVVTFYEHPRLVSLLDGRVVHEWSAIDSGTTVSSIVHDRPQPTLAIAPVGGRFAIATAEHLVIVTFEKS